MELIPEAKHWWRLSSVQLSILGVALNAAATGWSAFQGAVDPLVFSVVNMILGIAVAVSRVIAQPSLPREQKEGE
ncbi:hypothetical protein A6723_024235 [Pseudomonas sp. AU11447]|uniref:DUF7940 domain-containing protein n=1 Tax=unclassified Pseudomonas TaxID=196821 RepID=UPI0006D3C0ED|nr:MULTISPECIES: hypothetical protein [unclassified Pseudomonas]OBY91168.1 hypothetical protein A6723_024235 [Pseudomonas sp. AU11447]